MVKDIVLLSQIHRQSRKNSRSQPGITVQPPEFDVLAALVNPHKGFLTSGTVQRMQQTVGNHLTGSIIQRDREMPAVTTRQTMGLLLVRNLAGAIRSAGQQYHISPELVGVIIMHESQAAERSIWGNETLANAAERAQAMIQGGSTSVGIGQMRLDVGEGLRRGHPELAQNEAVIDDLLDQNRAVYYVAARLADLRTQIETYFSSQHQSLTPDLLIDLTAAAYNMGWDSLRRRNLEARDMGANLAERADTVRSRSQYIRLTSAFLPLMRAWLQIFAPAQTITSSVGR